MKAARGLLAAATVMLLLAACSVVSHAAYSYHPARPHPAAGQHQAPGHPEATPAPARPGPLPVRPDSYWGIYEPGTPASYRPVQRFTGLIHGDAPRIVLYFSTWGEPFQASYARTAWAHHAVTLVQIQPGNLSLAAIAAGRFDGYLRSYAQQVRAFGEPVIIGFAHEMNGYWYPWGFGHASPRAWIAAWRHVVTLFRQQGADNVTWLWTANVMGPGIPSPRRWWPGAAYVTWVGIDGYYYVPGDTFAGVIAPTIARVRAFTGDPILLAETGIMVGAVPATMPDLIAGLRRSRLLGLVWFDAVVDHDWRLEGHPGAVAAFGRGVAGLRRAPSGGR